MPKFDRDPDTRDVIVTFRMTQAEADWLTASAEKLGLRGRADVLRLALDFWQNNAPEAKKLPK